jgi:hypothetical protein
MNRYGDVPPAGPDLPLKAWATFVTRRVREFLPDVSVKGSSKIVVWTRGRSEARLDATRADWWLRISSTTSAGTGISTHSDRHDNFTAEVTASNVVVHFDGRFCRGLGVAPYSDHDYKILQGKQS